jgi:diacylglycerol kinase
MPTPRSVESSPPDPARPGGTLARSFGHALDGVAAGRAERNFRIHLAAGSAVTGAAALLPLSTGERLALVLCVGGVVAAELFNTAVEAVVDLQVSTFHPQARRAKDAAAGAVLVLAATSVLVGLVVAVAHRGELDLMRDRFVAGFPAWLGQLAATLALVAAPLSRRLRRVVMTGGLAAAAALVAVGASVPVVLAGVLLLLTASMGETERPEDPPAPVGRDGEVPNRSRVA